MNGFSLIEVMVSLLLMSVMLLCAIQTKISIQAQFQQAADKQNALCQALSIIERLQVNKDDAFKLREIEQWQQETSQLLPHGQANLFYNKEQYTISIKWKRS